MDDHQHFFMQGTETLLAEAAFFPQCNPCVMSGALL